MCFIARCRIDIVIGMLTLMAKSPKSPNKSPYAGFTQLAFYVNLHRAVSGPSATLTGRWRPDIDLRRMLTGYLMISSTGWAYRPTSRVVCSVYRYYRPKNNANSDSEYSLQGVPLVIYCFKPTPRRYVKKYYCAIASNCNKGNLHEILVHMLPQITAENDQIPPRTLIIVL